MPRLAPQRSNCIGRRHRASARRSRPWRRTRGRTPRSKIGVIDRRGVRSTASAERNCDRSWPKAARLCRHLHHTGKGPGGPAGEIGIDHALGHSSRREPRFASSPDNAAGPRQRTVVLSDRDRSCRCRGRFRRIRPPLRTARMCLGQISVVGDPNHQLMRARTDGRSSRLRSLARLVPIRSSRSSTCGGLSVRSERVGLGPPQSMIASSSSSSSERKVGQPERRSRAPGGILGAR